MEYKFKFHFNVIFLKTLWPLPQCWKVQYVCRNELNEHVCGNSRDLFFLEFRMMKFESTIEPHSNFEQVISNRIGNPVPLPLGYYTLKFILRRFPLILNPFCSFVFAFLRLSFHFLIKRLAAITKNFSKLMFCRLHFRSRGVFRTLSNI